MRLGRLRRVWQGVRRAVPPLPRPLWGLVLVLFALWLLAAASACAQDAVSATDLAWHDAARNRDVPVRIYAPAPASAPLPVIVFSHGLGGSRNGYAYLGRYWAGHGYISVHVEHLGSDTEALRSPLAMREAALNPANLVNRPKDISFAIDQITRLNAEPGPWHNRFDLARIGVAGHSFGAYTTMAIAGTSFPLPLLHGLADSRVKAIVAMSVPHLAGASYGAVKIPALHFTGTEDTIALQGSSSPDRRIPYDQSSGPDTYLVVFQGGDHMVFSGRLAPSEARPNDALFQGLVCRGSTAFWDAYLKDDAQAKAWLSNGGFKEALGASATLEKK